MGLNKWPGRIPNVIKEQAKNYVDREGGMAYQYACYNTGFGDCPEMCDPAEWAEHQKYDFRLIDCIVKELKSKKLW